MLSSPEMEEKEAEVVEAPKPADWFNTLLSLQADLLYNCFTTLSSPFFTLLSAAFESYRRAEETTANVETAVQNLPSSITHGSTVLLKRVGLGLFGAAQMCMVLVFLMVLAAFVGIGLVQLWAEEPVFVREKLFFDYTEVNPTAVFCAGVGGFDGGCYRKKQMGVPVGHTIHVYLLLLMPESDFNRDIGVFQLNAELISINGDVIGKSSQSVMLRFTSLPLRLARTFFMAIPLLLGISSETQKVKIEILRYKEGYPRSEAVRVTLAPRTGTLSLPQLYEAEIIMNSQLPWSKQLVHNWKWTLSVWMDIALCVERDASVEELREPVMGGRRNDRVEVSDLMSKWQHSRRKRKAIFLNKEVSEIAGSSASSISLTREDKSAVIEDDVGDSESVCLGG
ncbi:hypothetical protein GOBAR_AA21613 [Gossypium barbadense]|uniref:Seipin n=1 Tax=Gossypium barbadense TaxID=3634 RepID=A0A2P5X6V3_GOSBA|nr:hypothetical protein GOBAR_AA21613 [Gossypium barbadense]